MQTSYFGNIKKVRNPLSIASRSPRSYKGPQFLTLAPPVQLVRGYRCGDIDKTIYTASYKKFVLSVLDPETIYQTLIHDYGEDVTLLCYENPGEFCHRRLVADWFYRTIDVFVDEMEA